MSRLYLFFILVSLFLSVHSRTAEEWKTRTIYQMLTDRFARSDGSTVPCEDLSKYCGGTFKGMEKNLDYIQNLGANAIWISPIQKNSPGSYHGYAITDIYAINENFGSEQDFKDLVHACHERDIYVMVDVVPNHVAYRSPKDDPLNSANYTDADFSDIVPFNKKEHYHWPVFYCKTIDDNDPNNQTALEKCWLWGLPDLNHDNPIVRNTLLEWVREFVQKFELDGLRIDAVRHVDMAFWDEFGRAAGVFTMGEVFRNDTDYVAKYQGAMDSLLNFPFHKELLDAFHSGKSMKSITEYYRIAKQHWQDIGVLGNFMGNHDLVRFLYKNPDVQGLKSAQAFVLCSVGIPVIYYGDEQGFEGGDDPANREALWTSMNTESEMYKYFQSISQFRQRTKFFMHDQIERDVDDHFYSFSRGDIYFAFTNSVDEIKRAIKNHNYPDGTHLCNIFTEKDCVEVINGGFELNMKNKEVRILYPNIDMNKEKGHSGIINGIKNALSSAFTVGQSSGDM